MSNQTNKTQRDQEINLLWTIGPGGLAGSVIGTVLANQIKAGAINQAFLLVISIFLISGYTGTRRRLRLIAATVIAAFSMALDFGIISIPGI